MTAKHLTSAAIAGLIAAGLFLLVFGIGLGFVFMFLPALPLLLLGLSRGPQLALIAIAFATFIIALPAGSAAAVIFLMFLGLPAWYICKKSLLSRSGQWFPVGLIFTTLTLYASSFVAFMTLYYASEPGGMPQMLAQSIHDAFSDMESEYGDIISALASNWSFLVFSSTVWLWGLVLYAHAWLANRVLAHKNLQIRPNFAIEIFYMPGWMLTLLAICALASLIGSESVSFLGKSTLITLLFPYFLLGAAILQETSKNWPSRRLFLFFIYFFMLVQFWSTLILVSAGLWHQIKGLSAGENSFKS